MTREEFKAAANYWEEKDANSVKMDEARLKEAAEEYILANKTCVLATGVGDYVRCTPLEYCYHDGCFWIFSEGGKKFIGLADNLNVCLAIYNRYEDGGGLKGMQVMGKAEMVEPYSERYMAHAAFRNLSAEFFKKLKRPMPLICVHPETIECLFTDFKKLGCAARQTLVIHNA